MKISKLITYGITGIIVGLIAENSMLRIRQRAGKKARTLKKKLDKA